MIKSLGVIGVIGAIVATGFVYSGVYPMGADVPHNKLTYWVLGTMRERSVTRAASDITVPDLSSASLLLAGGPDYNDMCSGCHLRPGKTKSDMSIGLYPTPPNLAETLDSHGHDHRKGEDPIAQARRSFWIIKHGIKASGMPAWGPTHDDDRIWAMVAFLQKLPELTSEQYQILTARSDDDMSYH